MPNKAEMPNSAGIAESPSILAQQFAGHAQQIAEDMPLETSEHEARPYAAGDEKAGQIVDAEWTPLGDLVSRFPEINLGNYGDEEVRALQEWAFEAVDALKVADARPAPAVVQSIYPEEMTPELRYVLGFPNFRCAPYAAVFRQAGHNIKHRAEDEQAFVIHRMVRAVLQCGAAWDAAFAADLRAAMAAAAGLRNADGGA